MNPHYEYKFGLTLNSKIKKDVYNFIMSGNYDPEFDYWG
jgi:hypothetical protein